MTLSSASTSLLALTLLGCAGTASSLATPDVSGGLSRSHEDGAVETSLSPPESKISIIADARSALVVVRLTLDRPILDWTLPDQQISQLTVADARGVLETTTDGNKLHLATKRDPVLPITLTYGVSPTAGAERLACPFALGPDHAHFCGSAVLAIPTEDEAAAARSPLSIELQRDRELHRDAATSLAPIGVSAGPSAVATTVERVTVSFDDLAHTAFVFGALGEARFSAVEGRDHAAWLGYFGFDPRWASAEAAGVRTMVDQWFGIKRPADDPSVGMVFLQGGAGRDVRVESLFRGVLIVSGVSATWTARARLDVTRRLVQRTLGSVRIDSRDGVDSIWFDEGIAHAAALYILQGAGILTRGEVAAEVSSLLAEEVLSPERGASVVELGRAAMDPARGAAARRLLAVKGALLGLSTQSGASLREALRAILDTARGSHGHLADEVALDKLVDAGNRARAPGIREAFLTGQEIPLRASDIDSCVAIEERQLYPYELGYQLATDATGVRTIEGVTAGSPAARAGLKAGQIVASLDAGARNADSPIRVEVEQETGNKVVEFLPRGKSRRGRVVTVDGSLRCIER